MTRHGRLGAIVAATLLAPIDCAHSPVRAGREPGEVVLVGRVIGHQVPIFGWPGEFTQVDYLYVRVRHVLRGDLPQQYIGIAYGSNPGSHPAEALPESMFDGRSVWRFRVVPFEPVGRTLEVDISREPGDWSGAAVPDPEGPDIARMAVHPKCVLVAGAEAERPALSKASPLRLLWLNRGQFSEANE